MLFGCKVNKETVIGSYQLKNFPKSTLSISKDGTYTFTKINPNPYLHSFEHPDEYYFKTTGTWNLGGNIMKFKGATDSLEYELAELITKTVSTDPHSTFKFQDEDFDPVNILFVRYPDSTTVFNFHRSLGPIYYDEFPERDTLTFLFYGYRPWTYVRTDSGNLKYLIQLLPEYKPNYFDSLYLKVKPNSIGTGKVKFLRDKSM